MTSPSPLEAIFFAALEKDSPQERAAYLDAACSGDAALRRHVEKMLAAERKAHRFLEQVEAAIGSTVEYPPAEDAGTVIGPYKLLEQIGEGGFGVVFLAEQARPVRRRVAVKVLKPGMDSRQVIARFEAERQALALMDHPNIARVFDGGATPAGRPYFVMELVKGMPITEFCDQNHLTPRQRLELFISVCQAVQHAHQKGIIHRDLKPSNVLVSLHDTTPVVKVIDFGIAKALGQDLTDKTLFTGFAQMIGTPLYMSPEQAGSSGLDVDTRTDIYALGVLLYELLTGTTPFDKERLKTAGYDEIRRIIREEEPARPSTRLSTLGPVAATVSANRGSDPKQLSRLVRGELDWIVLKALEKDRSRRYATANGLAADVHRYLAGGTVQAVPPSLGYQLRKFARRHKRAMLGTALLGLTLLVLAGGVGWVVSDRAARRARASFEVGQYLQRAESLYADNKLPEALVEAEKARSVLGTGDGDEELHRRVEQRFTDFKTATELEEIMMEFTGPVDRDRVYAEFARAFKDYGIDMEALSTEEASARIANSHIKLDLVLALDRWTSSLRADDRQINPNHWQKMQAILRAADPDPWRQRFYAAREAKDLKTLRELADGADLCRLRTRVLAALGDSLRKADDAEASVAFLRKAQRRHPTDYSINVSLGWSLRNLKPPQWDDAIAFRRIAVAVRPRSPMANFYLGWSLEHVGKRDDALPYYQAAVDLDARNGPAQYSLANVLSAQGRSKDALDHFRKAVKLLPDDPFPLNGLAWELTTCAEPKLRDSVEAIELAKKVMGLSHKQGDHLTKLGRERLCMYGNTLGVAHYRAGQLEEALAALQNSMDFAEGSENRHVCEDWFFLAMVNWKLDRESEARTCYDQAVAWMDEKEPRDAELLRFRTEAAELLGVVAPPPRDKR